jgi:fructose-bisphosphate aldolase, class I
MTAATSAAPPAARRATLDDLGLPTGKKARLRGLLHQHGLKNGTALVLPIDQGLEHGPIDFLVNPAAADPTYQFELASRGGYNAIACQIGFAEKYFPKYAGEIPLILKVNGKTSIPEDDAPHSPLNATAEDAVRLGADAVGFTLYVGSAAQSRNHEELAQVRRDCLRFGLPLIVWAYPRGAAVERKGGRDSLYAVDYAARVVMELGGDVVKLNVPQKSDQDALMPKPYRELEWDFREGTRRVVTSAEHTLVWFSGGSRISDVDLLEKTRLVMEAGANGLIFGRNLWQRPMADALAITERIKEILADYGTPDGR